MSLAKGKFGIEYNPRPLNDGSSGLGWIFVIVALVALGSFGWVLVGRFRGEGTDEAEQLSQAVESGTRIETGSTAASTNAPPLATGRSFVMEDHGRDGGSALEKRPARVRNLLMRLEMAEKARDIELAATTIEQIRALPGSPAADLDDALARRLGVLNLQRLFVKRSGLWVRQVEVKRGDSASRIAYENGSTIASFARLNGGNVDKVILGQKLYVMNHPRFNLVIHRRLRMADLLLNGKFFKRYDLQDKVKAEEGAYEIPSRIRSFWGELGLTFKVDDRTELEMLLPKGATVLVSEL